jgi:hypothetical protein
MSKAKPAPRSMNHQFLLEATAEMLAMPEMICRHRRCRRMHQCHYHSLDTAEPSCLLTLYPWARALFDELFAIVRDIHDAKQSPYPSRDPERRELEEAAITVVRASLPLMPEIQTRFQDWCRRYYAPPPLPVDTGKLLADIRAELAHDRMLLEMAELRSERRRIDPRS